MVFLAIFSISTILSYHRDTLALDSPAITVSPGVLNIELTEPNQTVESEITISSNYSEATVLEASLSGVDDSSGNLVANGDIAPNLAQSLSLSSSQIDLPANSISSLYLKVTNSEQLSPGGHYATIALAQKNPEGSQVNLQSTISIGVFIVKRGGEKVDLQVKEQVLKISAFKLPSSSTLNFINTGNILLTPRGSVTIRSIDGKKVYSKGISNEGSLSMLPGKNLTDTFPIKNVSGLPIIPTKLKYITEYRADGLSEARYIEAVSWYIPPIFIVFCILVLIFVTTVLTKLIKNMRSKKNRLKQKNKSPIKPKAKLIVDISKPPTNNENNNKTTD